MLARSHKGYRLTKSARQLVNCTHAHTTTCTQYVQTSVHSMLFRSGGAYMYLAYTYVYYVYPLCVGLVVGGELACGFPNGDSFSLKKEMDTYATCTIYMCVLMMHTDVIMQNLTLMSTVLCTIVPFVGFVFCLYTSTQDFTKANSYVGKIGR